MTTYNKFLKRDYELLKLENVFGNEVDMSLNSYLEYSNKYKSLNEKFARLVMMIKSYDKSDKYSDRYEEWKLCLTCTQYVNPDNKYHKEKVDTLHFKFAISNKHPVVYSPYHVEYYRNINKKDVNYGEILVKPSIKDVEFKVWYADKTIKTYKLKYPDQTISLRKLTEYFKLPYPSI